MSDFSYDAGLPPEPPVTPPPVSAPGSTVSAAHRRDLSPEELASLPLQALLVRSGRLSIDQLSEALRENVSTGRAVEDIAVDRGWVPAAELEELKAAKAAYAPAPAAPAPPPVAPEPPPVAPAPPPVAPAPEPVQMVAPAPPAPPAEPVVVPPPPAHVPEPVQEAPARAAPPPIIETNGDGKGSSVGVFLTLADGERIWVGRYADAEAGEQRAHEVVEALMRPEPGVWPRFGNRLVRPDSVVAVEVSKRRDD